MKAAGGILISGPVYDLVRNKLSLGFGYLGQQPVKNVSEPVISCRIVLDGEAACRRQECAEVRRDRPALVRRPRHAAPAGLLGKFLRLPRLIRVFTVVSVFLFAIDMFDGPEVIWFRWPVAGMALFALPWLSLVGHRKRQ